MGMITPERLPLLRKGYEDAQSSGLHAEIMPHVLSFASELAGLLSDFRKRLSSKS